MKHYMIYERVSTAEQEVDTQQKDCLSYIKNKENGQPYKYEVFSDPDTSASKVKMHKRPSLMKFLNSLQPGKHVVVFKLDRFSRDVIEMVTIYRMIKAKGCTLHSLNDPDCDNEFMIGLMGVLAQKERKDISDRTKAQLRSKKAKGELTGQPPYGFTLCPQTLVAVKNRKTREIEWKTGKLIEDVVEQSVLSHMCKLHDQGISFRLIAKELGNLGYTNRANKPFHHMSVYRILVRIGKTKWNHQPPKALEHLLSPSQ